jgi:hypothetical protein
MLNRRHKTILFITFVMTGSVLLAGAKLSEALGVLILGIAFAWLIGSQTTSRTYDYVRRVPGKTWPWLKLLLVMAIGGCLLVGVAVWSNFNSFIVAAALSIFGMLISPIQQLPTQRRWLKLLVWVAAFVAFFLAVAGASELCHLTGDEPERVGELATYGLIALPIGMLWLMKGWRLIVAGITAKQSTDATEAEATSSRRGAIWLHVFLFAGVLVLTVLLGLLTFSAFSDSVFAFQGNASSKPPNYLAVLFLMLLARWPYACWRSILRREPNTTPVNVKRHKRTTIALGGLFTVVLCVAATFGIQNGNDRMTTAEIEGSTKDFQDVAAKIGSIKNRNLKTTKDYIDAYEEIDPLIVGFDGRLQRFTDVLSQAQERERNRGPFSIQRLYGRKEKEWWSWDTQVFELLRQDDEITKKQVLVVNQMAALPEEAQVEFWKKNFQPLIEQEDVLRQKLAGVQKSKPATEK